MHARRWSITGVAVPARRDGKPTSHDNSRHHVGELIRFFRWLDSSSAYRWQMPRGLERVERKIPKTDGERRLSAITKDIYTVEELAELNRHATPVERLVLYLGLELCDGCCGTRATGQGRLSASPAHPYAERLHFSRRPRTRSPGSYDPRRTSSASGCCGTRRFRWLSGGWSSHVVSSRTCSSSRNMGSPGIGSGPRTRTRSSRTSGTV